MNKESKENKRPHLVIRTEFEGMFSKLTDSERGKLLTALMAYQLHGKEPDKLPEKLYGTFLAMQSFVDRDNLKYAEKCETNRKNAKERWE